MILLLIFNLPADLQAQGASRLATLEPLLSQSEDYSSSTGSRYRIEFERLVPEKGPDPDEPNCMFQDRHGFMWFGTSFGLLKYDGYTAIVYDHDPQNLNSLSDNLIMSLLQVSSGMIWVGTGEGLNRLDPESDTIVRYRHEPGNPNSLQNNTVYAICEDNAGVLWLGTGAGLIKRDPQTGQFTLYENLPGALNSDGHNGVLDVLEDKSGVLWIGSSEGLVSFDGAREKFVRYFHDPENPRSLSDRFIRSLYEDKQGVLWVGTSFGLSRMVRDDSGNISFERYIDEPKDQYNYSNNIIWSIFEDKSDVLWVAVQNGLYRMSRGDEGTSEFIRCQVEIASGYNNEKVGAVYEDNTGTLWIDVSGAVYKSNRQSEAISHYNHDPDNLNSLSHNQVTEILEDKDGILWLGTADGLNRFDRKNNKWTHFQADPANPNSLSHNRILSICEDQSNQLWIGTIDGGLNKFDPQKNEWTRYQNYDEPNGLSYWRIPSVYVDRGNVLWVGTWHGILNKYDRQTDTFVRYENDPGDPNTISKSKTIVSIFEDSAGILWIGTDGGGLNRFDRGQNQFTRYRHEPGNSKSLSHNTVTVIHEAQPGVLWIGTPVGLNKLDTSTSSPKKSGQAGQALNETDSLARNEPYFVHYLSDRFIDGLLDDDDGNLWISSAGGSHSGLTRFNYQSETFRDFSAQGTLLHKSQRSGEMFVADHHHTGFYSFYPSAMKSNHHAPTIAITDFQIFNKSVPVAGSWWGKNGTTSIETYRLKKSLTATKEIELSYKESVFSFEFAALHYADPGKNEYAYKMEGFDDDWNYIGTRRFTTFTGLPAGEYTFRVKGSNNDGVWNEEGTSIKVIITPPPWKTWWAYTLYIIAVGATLYGIRRFELSRTRLKHKLDLEHIHAEKLEEIDRMKSRFFANISHEFRTPLTLILGPLEKLLSDKVEETVKKQFRVMLRNGRRLLRLINQLLDLSKLEAGSMSLKTRPENIIPLLKGIVLSFSSLAERKRITLRFQPPQPSEGSEPSEGLIVYVDRDKLEKIVSNLLSNAFKFTPEKGKISVAVSTTQSHAEITVADSGVGIPNEKLEKIFDRFYQADDSYTREQEGSGIGLALTKELVELHRGEIRVTSEPGMGTTFTVCLPLGKDHLKAEEEIAETAVTKSTIVLTPPPAARGPPGSGS